MQDWQHQPTGGAGRRDPGTAATPRSRHRRWGKPVRARSSRAGRPGIKGPYVPTPQGSAVFGPPGVAISISRRYLASDTDRSSGPIAFVRSDDGDGSALLAGANLRKVASASDICRQFARFLYAPPSRHPTYGKPDSEPGGLGDGVPVFGLSSPFGGDPTATPLRNPCYRAPFRFSRALGSCAPPSVPFPPAIHGRRATTSRRHPAPPQAQGTGRPTTMLSKVPAQGGNRGRGCRRGRGPSRCHKGWTTAG